MPTGDSKIKFSVEGITQLHQSFQSILNDSKALTEEWAKQGTAITKSLQEQIQLLKQRNSSAWPPSPLPPTGSQQVREDQARLKDVNSVLESLQADGFKLHEDSIKELAELIKNSVVVPTSRTSQTPERQETSEKEKTETESPQSKLLRNLALTSLLRPLQSNDPIQSGIQGVSGLGTALMGMGGKMGVLGLGVAAVGGVMGARYSAVSRVAPTAAQTARLLGGTWEDWTIDRAGADYGLGKTETLQRRMELARAMGRQNLGSAFNQALLWESSTMLTSSDIAAFARSARGDRGFDLGKNLTAYFEMLRKSGISSEKIQTQMSEYLKELVSLNTMQLEKFGKADTFLNTALYSAIAQALPQTAESNPALIGRIAGSIYSGLSTAPSKQVEALQYSIASRVMGPEGDWYRARMIREDPFGLAEGTKELTSQKREYAQQLLDTYKQIAPDGSQLAFLFEQQFQGITANAAYALANKYLEGQINLEGLTSQAKAAAETKTLEDNMRQKLPSNVDSISQTIAHWEELKIGNSIQDIQVISSSILGIMRKFDIFITSLGENSSAMIGQGNSLTPRIGPISIPWLTWKITQKPR